MRYKITGLPTKIENWPRPLLRPRTDHVCHQKSNPSRELSQIILEPLLTVTNITQATASCANTIKAAASCLNISQAVAR